MSPHNTIWPITFDTFAHSLLRPLVTIMANRATIAGCDQLAENLGYAVVGIVDNLDRNCVLSDMENYAHVASSFSTFSHYVNCFGTLLDMLDCLSEPRPQRHGEVVRDLEIHVLPYRF